MKLIVNRACNPFNEVYDQYDEVCNEYNAFSNPCSNSHPYNKVSNMYKGVSKPYGKVRNLYDGVCYQYGKVLYSI